MVQHGDAKPALTYSVVIATCDRHDMLAHCVEQIPRQARLPIELVIIDATACWQDMKARLIPMLASRVPQVTLKYEGAWVRSITAQRNQGLALVSGDVVFFIDDDSLMYPDCAEAIMRVYEDDEGRAIVGCQAALADAPPSVGAPLPAQKARGATTWSARGRVRRWVSRHILMMAADQLFLPYWKAWKRSDQLPRSAEVTQVPLLNGCRMTYRRTALGESHFDADLGSYAAAEDLDASYRASRHGLLVEVLGARIYHHAAASGRLGRGHAAELSAMNVAFLVRKNGGAGLGALGRLYVWLGRRMVAEFLKDLFSGRLTLPQCRAMVRAALSAWSLWLPRARNLRACYADMQLAMARRHGESRL